MQRFRLSPAQFDQRIAHVRNEVEDWRLGESGTIDWRGALFAYQYRAQMEKLAVTLTFANRMDVAELEREVCEWFGEEE